MLKERVQGVSSDPNINKKHKCNKAVSRFWERARREDKLKLLQEYSGVKLFTEKRLVRKREQFNKDPFFYEIHRTNKKCFVCAGQAKVRHHVILLKNGGRNTVKNIVKLCNECHGKIHPWLRNAESVKCTNVSIPSMRDKRKHHNTGICIAAIS